MLNIIGGIETFDSGEYNLFGKETPDYNSYAGIKLLRYDISYLFQNFALISSRTVRENIEIGLQYSKLKRQEKNNLISEALIKVGLEGYDKRKVFELSGGEQQRVALARIILKPSKLILADEPTGSLDLKNREIVMKILCDLNKMGKTIIIVTHDPNVVQYASKSIAL